MDESNEYSLYDTIETNVNTFSVLTTCSKNSKTFMFLTSFSQQSTCCGCVIISKVKNSLFWTMLIMLSINQSSNGFIIFKKSPTSTKTSFLSNLDNS